MTDMDRFTKLDALAQNCTSIEVGIKDPVKCLG